MDILNSELIDKFLSPNDLVTVFIVWSLVKNKVSKHFESIEKSLVTIGEKIQSLNDSIISLEVKQTKRINNLSERVTNLEMKDKERIQ